MPEIIDNGETGFVVDTIATAVEAVKECAKLDRSHIRDVFERRFDADRMVAEYEAIYAGLLAGAKG